MNAPRNLAERNVPYHRKSVLLWIVILAWSVWICCVDVEAAEVEEPFRVMMLRNTSQYLPAGILQDHGMREAFAAKGFRQGRVFRGDNGHDVV
jgi:hypothetical protein